MTYPRVDDLVTGWVDRTYLKADGWWVQLVLDEFAFLYDLGYSLTASEWAGIHFHQKGHYIAYEGPDRSVVVEYDSDDPRFVTLGAGLVDHNPPGSVSLDDLIA